MSETLPVPAQGAEQAALTRLAREVVMDIRELDVILKDYNLTHDTYATLLKENAFFKKLVETYRIEWESALSTQQRIKVKAAAALEDNLVTLITRMNEAGVPLSSVVETAKFLAKAAGVGEDSRNEPTGERFKIIIDLGDDKKLAIEKDVTPITIVDDNPPLIPVAAKSEEL